MTSVISRLGLIAVGLLVSIGVFRAYSHGANDFSVFYEAWRLVLGGRGAEIYHVSPDRFLYEPGFAWILAPLGILPKTWSLGVWCLLKAFVLGFLIKKLSAPVEGEMENHSSKTAGIAALGIVLVARPLLIDLEYGQVNLFIVGACVWGLLGHFKKESSLFWDSARWSALTFAAVAKLFAIPLLFVPWLMTKGIPKKKLKYERMAVIIAAIVIVIAPAVTLGFQGTFNLLLDWREAVLAKGLPLEAHNQSFSALLHHYLSGNPTHIHAEGGAMLLGHKVLSNDQIVLLSLAWTLVTLGTILGWILSGSNHAPMKWIAVAIGLLIIPSHLVWKPYFVFSIPLAIFILRKATEGLRERGSDNPIEFPNWRKIRFNLGILVLFVGINLTGFDFVGHLWAAHFEAASMLLVMHLLMIGMALSRQ